MKFKKNLKNYQPWLLGAVWLYRLLPKDARAEEQSILKDALISDYEIYSASWTDKSMLIDENWTTYAQTVGTNQHSGMKELTIFLTK